MDPFLRRVVEQRELEQEVDIVAAGRELVAGGKCRLCRARLNASDLGPRTVCSGCGGRKREAVLELDEARERQVLARRAALLSLVVPTNPESLMSEERKTCPKCGKPLRSNNTRGYCSACLSVAGSSALLRGEAPAASGPIAAGGGRPKKPGNTRKSFRVITEALGVDGDQLLEDFMQGWLDRIRESVKVPGADEYTLSRGG